MSRQAASKSRAEKGASRGGGGAQSVVIPVVSNDIIPGRLTEADWTKLMIEDEDNNFIGSLVEDIVDTALQGCYQKYIEHQVLPFTVYQAKDAILQIVQWHFLSRDFGETDISNDSGWKEDSEPEAGVIDSWAQGSVPVVVRPQSSIAPSVSLNSEGHGPVHHAIDESVVSGTEPTATVISDEQTESTNKSVENEAEVPDLKDEASIELKAMQENDFSGETDPSEVVKKKKTSYKRHTGRLPPPSTTNFDKKFIPQAEPKKEDGGSEKAEHQLSPSQKSLIKVQAGRPPGNREVTFDERGNVVGVMKLNVQALPTHRVRVSYNIIDPEAEATAQRLTALRTGRLQKINRRSWKSERSLDETKSTISRKTGVDPRLKSHTASSYRTRDIAMSVQQFPPGNDLLLKSHRGPKTFVRERRIYGARIDPLPPLLIDTIDASPGVVVQEGEQVKKGPEEKYPVGVSRVPGDPVPGLSNQQQPLLRLLGDRYLHTKLRPILDPKEVVQDVNDSSGQTLFSVSSGFPKIGTTQSTKT